MVSRKKRLNQYRRRVLRFRIAAKYDTPGSFVADKEGLHAKQDRRRKMHEMFESFEAEHFRTSQDECRWCSKRQFCGYYVNFELYTREEAVDMWAKLESTGVASKTNAAGQKTYPVAMPALDILGTKTAHKKGSVKKRIASESSDAESDQVADVQAV